MNKSMLVLILAAIFLLLIVAIAIAAPEDFSLNWWTVDGGGTTSLGGGYELIGTIGQPDVGLLSGDNYELTGGFWESREIAVSHQIFLPLTQR